VPLTTVTALFACNNNHLVLHSRLSAYLFAGPFLAWLQAMEVYDFATATQRAYSWWQYELCDVFIELMKPVMARDEAADSAAAADKAATRAALCAALDAGLRLLHPFMPFVTEELWQRLPKTQQQVSIDSSAV
jgi:valyl-tRNA synthetase